MLTQGMKIRSLFPLESLDYLPWHVEQNASRLQGYGIQHQFLGPTQRLGHAELEGNFEARLHKTCTKLGNIYTYSYNLIHFCNVRNV